MSEPNDAVPGGAARLEVVGGGDPSAAELAALTVALTPVPGPAPERDGGRPPAWARAALLEGVGHRAPSRPSDLDATTRLG